MSVSTLRQPLSKNFSSSLEFWGKWFSSSSCPKEASLAGWKEPQTGELDTLIQHLEVIFNFFKFQ